MKLIVLKDTKRDTTRVDTRKGDTTRGMANKNTVKDMANKNTVKATAHTEGKFIIFSGIFLVFFENKISIFKTVTAVVLTILMAVVLTAGKGHSKF